MMGSDDESNAEDEVINAEDVAEVIEIDEGSCCLFCVCRASPERARAHVDCSPPCLHLPGIDKAL
jgi:hypothetical protein